MMTSYSLWILTKSHDFGLFSITNAAITPGTQPQIVSSKTIITEPHPLSRTERGGKKMANKTLQKLINNNKI
ncbi:hypothetical protein SAMN04488508_1086 [Aquimarina spongiae]|uniref:Uncharacterized protein n=1 Tax=Aquimarina spongiae TaxID=570521 RepID=A0A1M6IQ49_9FLAO|nr:hypothetical protein SAMN04488508_1086 [Aquimarina spongiae]